MGQFGCESCQQPFDSGHELMDHLSDEHRFDEWSEVAHFPDEKEAAI